MLLTVAREERAQVGKLKAINMTLFYCVYTGRVLFHPRNALTDVTVTVMTEH